MSQSILNAAEARAISEAAMKDGPGVLGAVMWEIHLTVDEAARTGRRMARFSLVGYPLPDIQVNDLIGNLERLGYRAFWSIHDHSIVISW